VSAAPSRPAVEAGTGLTELIEEFTNRLQAGEAVDVDAFVGEHPEHAEPLRRLLPPLLVLADLGRSDAPISGGPPGGPAEREGGVLGDFRIVREVGRGGMGVVYEAEQLSLGRRVALKVLPFAAALDGRQLQRFVNEARAAAGLHHTNIVPVYAVGSERCVHYYAMQFIDGHTLAALIHQLRRRDGREPAHPAGPPTPAGEANPPATGPYPAADAARQPAAVLTGHSSRDPAFFRMVAQLGIQAGEALEHAHQLGVVHRDVKPANLLVDGRGNLWVADFGLAHCQSQAGLTMTGDLVGTLRYMSPEQALAKRVPIDHRTDVYSLGVTLYELLTQEPAFAGKDRQELLRQVAFEEPRPPRRLNRAIPAELETVVLKAMEKNPQDRYATAQDLADDLRRFLQDEPIRAKRPTLVRRARKWARRRRAAVGAAAAVLLLAVLLGGGNGLWWLQGRAAARAEVAAELGEARRHLEREQWTEGLAAVARARAALAGVWGDARLPEAVEALGRDLEMVRLL
jgi:serine/threonine protein kinase